MKLEQITEMTTTNLNVVFKDGVDLVYGRKRVTIFSIDEKKEGEYVFNATKYWDAPSLTVKAKSPRAAFKTVRDNLEKKIFQAFGGATKTAENAGKQLGLWN